MKSFIFVNFKILNVFLRLSACSIIIFSSAAIFAKNRFNKPVIIPFVKYASTDKSGSNIQTDFKNINGAEVVLPNGSRWKLSLKQSSVTDRPDAIDYIYTWKLISGESKQSVVGVQFQFSDWSEENFLFVPAVIYDGNRFQVKKIDYPPYWYDKNEWRKDMPTTIANYVKTIGKGPGGGTLNLDAGDASTPLIGFQSPTQKLGWMVLTTQGSKYGETGMIIEENELRTSSTITLTAPGPNDQPVDFKQGDSISIRCRVFSFKTKTRTDFLKRFMTVRKDLNPSTRVENIPFSAAYSIMDDLYRNDRWDEGTNLFWMTKPEPIGKKPLNEVWQLGWIGGGLATFPLLMQGDEIQQDRAWRNLDVIFKKSQTKAGFFNAIGDGESFYSFGLGNKKMDYNETLIRIQGDWLYMGQRQIDWLAKKGKSVPDYWKTGLRKLADALSLVWEKNGQFGQFVDAETGEICIGGSTSGGIIPGALALASKAFNNPAYLETAKAAARKYHKDFVLHGYTCGGPGEILSAPDSESAFGLFESYMVLFEITGEKEWLKYAEDLLPICASWVVAYDFHFPPESEMGKINAHSTGAVWASVSNRHGAPAICTWSGDSLLKFYRATGNKLALQLIEDIAHSAPQYMSRADRPVGKMPPGGICERVNLSKWEGKKNVGGFIFASCTWVEVAAMQTFTMIPGLYVQPDNGMFTAFDNIKVEKKSAKKGKMTLIVKNPTKFAANVKVLVEDARERAKRKAILTESGITTISLAPGESKTLSFKGNIILDK